MGKRIYVETSVLSYLTARPSRDVVIAGRQEVTREIWPRLLTEYDTYVSALVCEEAGRGDPEQARARLAAAAPFAMLDIDQECQALAERIVEEKGIPEEYPEDALHVAVAAVNGISAIITWNFGHLNNPFTRMMVRQSVENEGYRCPEICTPEELLEVEE